MTSPEQIQAESPPAGASYNAAYYQSHCGPVPYTRSEPQWPSFFGSVADHLVRSLRPTRMLDVGCALGFLVEALWDRGVEAWGLDISTYAIANVRPDMREYCRLDSAARPIEGGPYDLITCIEVLEHMPEAEARSAIGYMTAASDTILFSSSPSDFDEPTHINVRPLVYWLQCFEEHGFSPDLRFDASFVAPHAMLLRRHAQPYEAEVVRLYAALLRLRCQFTERDNRYNEAVRDLMEARSKINQFETLKPEWDQLSAEAAGLRRTAAEQADEIAALKEQLAAATRTNEEIQAINDRARQDLDAAAARIAAYIAERNRREIDFGAAQSSLLESRFNTIEAQLARLNASVNSILQSRIWSTLVRTGGWVLKILPGAGRR